MSAKATTLKVSKHTDLTGTSTGYKVFAVIVLILVALFFLFPLYSIATGSFKPILEITSRTPVWFPQNPTLDRARHIAELLLDRFDAGEINSVWIIYTDMKNGLEAVVRQERILPMHREHFHAAAAAAAGDKAYEFVPSAGAVLDNAARSCLTGYIYSALVDSFCSEQSARMTAMNAADQNAEELLKDLSVQYNRARQAAITQEITEVSAGERAQRSKKEKEG